MLKTTPYKFLLHVLTLEKPSKQFEDIILMQAVNVIEVPRMFQKMSLEKFRPFVEYVVGNKAFHSENPSHKPLKIY